MSITYSNIYILNYTDAVTNNVNRYSVTYERLTTSNYAIFEETSEGGYTFCYNSQTDAFKSTLTSLGWSFSSDSPNVPTAWYTTMPYTSARGLIAAEYSILDSDSILSRSWSVPDDIVTAIKAGKDIYLTYYGFLYVEIYGKPGRTEDRTIQECTVYGPGYWAPLTKALMCRWSYRVDFALEQTGIQDTLIEMMDMPYDDFRKVYLDTDLYDVGGLMVSNGYSATIREGMYYYTRYDDDLTSQLTTHGEFVWTDDMYVPSASQNALSGEITFAKWMEHLSCTMVIVPYYNVSYIRYCVSSNYYPNTTINKYWYTLWTKALKPSEVTGTARSTLSKDFILGNNPAGYALVAYPDHRQIPDTAFIADSDWNATDITVPIDGSATIDDIEQVMTDYDLSAGYKYSKEYTATDGGTLDISQIAYIDTDYQIAICIYAPYNEYLISGYSIADLVDTCKGIEGTAISDADEVTIQEASDAVYEYTKYVPVSFIGHVRKFPHDTTIESVINAFKDEYYAYMTDTWINHDQTVVRHDVRDGTDYAYVYVLDSYGVLSNMTTYADGQVTGYVVCQNSDGADTGTSKNGAYTNIIRCKVMSTKIRWSGSTCVRTPYECPLSSTLDDHAGGIWLLPTAEE